jgi:ribosomal protein S17E
MPKLPEPFSSDFQQFSKVVGILADLTAEGRVRLKSSPGSNITFNVDPALLNERTQREQINRQIVLRILDEVSAITSLKLRGRINTYYDRLLEQMNQKKERLSLLFATGHFLTSK